MKMKMMMCRQGTAVSLLRNRLHTKHRKNIFDQTRSVSVLNNYFISSDVDPQVTKDLDKAIALVRKYDPSGYLPGLMAPTREARIGYFAVRAFWLQSRLRFNEAPLANSVSASRQVMGVGAKGIEVSDEEGLQKWKMGVHCLYDGKSDNSLWEECPTLRLLHHVIQKHTLSRKHFDNILAGRELDLHRKQYPTVSSLTDHANMSCGSLFHLILECSNIGQSDEDGVIYKTAQDLGIAHGLANALRTSVPVASATGKIIIPQDLCDKYGIRSPRYLLSALGMGDEECRKHLQSAVKDIAFVARDHLEKARLRRDDILSHPDGETAVSVFLPGLASESFLNRLEIHQYDLTDRNLRSVGFVEHLMCASRIFGATLKKTY